MKTYLATEVITRKIYFIRGHKVLLDRDLADLYEVEPFNLNKAVRRNIDRFPQDFMFQLNKQEFQLLRFQFGISNKGRGGRRYLPLVFTEQGVAMLSSVLQSKRAAHVNVAVMRAFVKLRNALMSNEELARKLYLLEDQIRRHDKRLKKYSREIGMVFNAIRALMSPEKQKIGFRRGRGG